MSPVVLYAEHRTRPVASASEKPTYSCVVDWPTDSPLTAARAYVGYTVAMGFLLPVSGVCVFYGLLVARLKSKRRRINSISSQRQPSARRSVTCFVAIIVAVFIGCWLPYWCFQVRLHGCGTLICGFHGRYVGFVPGRRGVNSEPAL